VAERRKSVEEVRKEVRLRIQHCAQLADGLIPKDSPPTFTLPQPLNEQGAPWWFPPNFKPVEVELDDGTDIGELTNCTFDLPGRHT
jgi:hypothetical protein